MSEFAFELFSATEEEVRAVAEKLGGKDVTLHGNGEDFWNVRPVGYCQTKDSNVWSVIAEDLKEGKSLAQILSVTKGEVWTAPRVTNPVQVALYRPFYFRVAYGKLPKFDVKKYPHVCPRCQSPAYVGLLQVDCSKPGCR